ncbi:MAG: GerMN domain-containing protein, partial [Acidimicrobiales bacterium]
PPLAPDPSFYEQVLWPGPEHDQFADPVDAVRSFVDEFVGLDDPPLSSFHEGEPGAGEVDVFGRGEGGQRLDVVRSTVVVRRFDGHWYVTSASSDDVVIETPQPLADVTSPVRIDGRARGYEGTIAVSMHEGFTPAEFVSEPTIAGCCEELVPFTVTLPLFNPPTTPNGAIVARTDSGSDYAIVGFTAIPVRFVETPTQVSPTTKVTVFFTGENGDLVSVPRSVPRTSRVLTAALRTLLDGPTAADRGAGLQSWFDESGGAVDAATINEGLAVVTLARELAQEPGGPEAADEIIAQLNATVFQFDNVQTVQYELGGSCDDFDSWLSRGCEFPRP